MEALNEDFKKATAERLKAIIAERQKVGTPFYKEFQLTEQTCLKIRLDRLNEVKMSDAEWLRLGRKVQEDVFKPRWQLAKTDVYQTIEEDVLFCKKYAKAKICVDECGIGKTFAAKHLAKTLHNCFYVDASQGKTISLFTKNLAVALGIESIGKYNDIKADIKCYLKMIESPIVIIDEAGDFGQNAMQEVKEYWNSTEGYCGWYLMGADGLKYVIEKGIKNKKPGFKEIFSRFSEKYTTTVPIDRNERQFFYRKLITDVLSANMTDKNKMNDILRRCMIKYSDGNIGGLRRAESLMLLFEEEQRQMEAEAFIPEMLDCTN